MSVATRSKILDCFRQAVYPGKFSEKFLGRDPKNFLGRERSRVATGIFFWIATDYGSRPEFFSGSRPVLRLLGRDRIRSRPTGRWSPTLQYLTTCTSQLVKFLGSELQSSMLPCHIVFY
jgi:hypothetical protein